MNSDHEARRYWAAVAAGDKDAARDIAASVVARLRAKADEAEQQGKCIMPSALRLEAREIELGVLAPYPRPPDLTTHRTAQD